MYFNHISKKMISFTKRTKLLAIHGFKKDVHADIWRVILKNNLIPDILGHSQLESIQPYISVETKGLRQCALSISELPPIEGGLNYV